MPTFQPANEQLGYSFHPSPEAQAIGSSQLDVVIRPVPTGAHFDPEACTCLTAAGGGTTKLRVTHPWTQELEYRVCAGEIDIEDARHEHVKAFTFGGILHIDVDARHTVCRIASPVPLLEHTRHISALQEQLIEEVYILFAERRAAQDDDVFERRLAAADPQQLYHACLLALDEKFAHFPVTADEYRHFKQFLHDAARTLEDGAIPALADIL